MAEEMAVHKKVNVRQPEREWLLRFRKAEFMYEDLLAQAEEKIRVVDKLFDKSDLPQTPDPSEPQQRRHS